MRLLRRIAGNGEGKRLLDIGCGDGHFLLEAQRRGWQVSGTEIEPEQGRSHGLDIRAAVEEFGPDERFDCVTLWHSLEHLPKPLDTLHRVNELLKPGGDLLISVPDASGFQARLFGRHWLHLDVPRHLFHFNWQSLSRLLERSGFVIGGHWHHEIEYDLIGWSQSALNLVASEPNIFLYSLIRKPVRASSMLRAFHFGLGSVLTAAALPLAAISSFMHRGGTLIVAAKSALPCSKAVRCERALSDVR
ncbi:MAG TPA: class I SAM-dependent methyltransferase [Pirellulales bacterium]|nr:class I SAM-dependent methyltransferase [Pirellulales bacterium]